MRDAFHVRSFDYQIQYDPRKETLIEFENGSNSKDTVMI